MHMNTMYMIMRGAEERKKEANKVIPKKLAKKHNTSKALIFSKEKWAALGDITERK